MSHCMVFDGDFIAKALLSHGDLTFVNGPGRLCDGIRPVQSESKSKLGLLPAHRGTPWIWSG